MNLIFLHTHISIELKVHGENDMNSPCYQSVNILQYATIDSKILVAGNQTAQVIS